MIWLGALLLLVGLVGLWLHAKQLRRLQEERLRKEQLEQIVASLRDSLEIVERTIETCQETLDESRRRRECLK